MQQFVYMRHPDIADLAGPVSRKSFDVLWEDKGWVVVDPAEELEKKTLAELRKMAEQRGLEVEGRNKPAYIAALRELVDVSETEV